ncbi:DMD protein, partial [Polypterus senegalus]
MHSSRFVMSYNSVFHSLAQAGKSQIQDLFTDLRDGRQLLELLEGLAGHELAKEKGFTRVHALNNVNRALQVLQKNNVELVNIGGADIVDGNHKLTLGLIWSIILHWQVKDVMKNIMAGLQQTNSEKILLSWVRQLTRDYQQVNVVNFTTSWSDGLAFNALIHSHRPDLFEWNNVLKLQSAAEKLDHAFNTAKQHLGIEKLLDPEDVAIAHPDKKSIIMYVTSLFQVLPQQVTIEAIQEVEMLPRPTKFTPEGHFQLQHQQRYSQQITVSVAQGRVRTPSPSPKPRYKSYAYTQAAYVTSPDQKRRRFSPQPEGLGDDTVGSLLMEPEVHLDSYQSALEEVLTWLLSAEDTLHSQKEISRDVEEVKEQFHTHEGFMVELTSHQGNVGKVLQAGSQLLSVGKLTEDEENEIEEQMNLLNSRWENLRVASMERQSKLHEVLMDLQHQQLQQLADWLGATEARINKMEIEPLGPDLEDVKRQVEKHKLLQEDLETEQVRVNSLTHMVVVVDESSGDSATAALEEKLQCLFDAWLTEKEDTVNKIQTTGFKDQNEMVANLRKLAMLKEELEMKRHTMDKLCSLSKDLLSAMKSKNVAEKLEARLENIARRWDALVQTLERNSVQISQAVSAAQTSAAQASMIETVTMVTREQTLVKTVKEELPPAPPQKKRQLVVDSELRKRFDVDCTELHSWMTRSEAILQSPEFGVSRKEGSVSELQERVNAIEKEKPEKLRKLQDASRSAQALVEQLVNEGLNADDIRQASEQLNTRWVEFCQLLGERLAWLDYQNKITAFYSQLQQLEQTVTTAENWLKSQQPPATEAEPIKIQLEKCKDEVARLSNLQPQVEKMKDQEKHLKEKEEVPMFLEADITALTTRYKQVLVDLQARENLLNTILNSLPPARYKETVTTLHLWIQQAETKLTLPQVTVTNYLVMEQRLKDLKSLQGSLQEQQEGLNYLTSTMEDVCKKAPVEISQKYRAEIEAILCRWKKLSTQLGEQIQKLEELMTKLQQFQNDTKTLKKWIAEVDVFLNEEWPALGDSEALEKQLEQCTALVNDIQTIQPSLNGINDVGQILKNEAEPTFSIKLQEELTELNAQWDSVCKQAYAKKSALKGGLDKTISLRKDLSEMQEWISQAEEDYLERDFEYKSPEELKKAVEELKRAKEEVEQKEVKVKLLTDSVNGFIAKSPPAAHETLKSELNVLTSNYQRLCSRLNGKCKTLEEVWSCWCELLSYLESENRWLDELESKLRATDNIQGGAEEISEAMDSLESVMRHPDDNRNQIRELAQTLTDGGILDELINEKLETFNIRWEELQLQAVSRQKALEQSIQSAQENDKALRLIQESLSTIDRHLSSYIADHIDASQIPQEAQKKLQDVSVKFRLFQKPANFEQRLQECKLVLDDVKAKLPVLEMRSVEQDVVQSQLDQCMKFYKNLSEVKSEVETVIKTGRQIVQKQQTENPKELDDRLTALKLQYNELGAQDEFLLQVTEGKQELEKCLKLSRKLRKEVNTLTEWLAATDAELTKRSAVEGMPTNLDAEVAWGKAIQKETEKHQQQLKNVSELAEALKAVLHGKENLVDDKVSLLNCNWIAVTSRAEEWLNLLLDYQNQMEIFDQNIAQITAWIYRAEILLDESEKQESQEKVLKQLSPTPSAISVVSTPDEELKTQRSFLAVQHKVQQEGEAEELAVKDLLQKGEHLQQRVLDERKREEIRKKQHLLNTKYNIVKDLRSIRKKKALAISPQWYQYKRQTDDLLQWLDEIEKKVASLPDPRDDQRMKDIDADLEKKREDLNALNRQAQSLSREGAAMAVEPSLIQLSKRWQEIESKFAQFRRLNLAQIHTIYEEKTIVTSEEPFSETSHVPSVYLAEIYRLLQSIAEVEFLLNSPEYWASNFHDFSKQEDCLKKMEYKPCLGPYSESMVVTELTSLEYDSVDEDKAGDHSVILTELEQRGSIVVKKALERPRKSSKCQDRLLKLIQLWDQGTTSAELTQEWQQAGNVKASMGKLSLWVDNIQNRKSKTLQNATPSEAEQISNALCQLDARWEKVNKLHRDRRMRFDRSLEKWQQFHSDLKRIAQWLSEAERILADTHLDPSSPDQTKVKENLKVLQHGIDSHQAVVAAINATGEEILQDTPSEDTGIFKGKLATVNSRWQEVCRLVNERRKRVQEEKNILSGLQEDLNEFNFWLEEADSIAAIHLEPGNEQQLKDSLEKVKVRVEELPPHKKALKHLNETGSLILGSTALSPEEQKKLQVELKEANSHWAQVMCIKVTRNDFF